MTDRAATRRAGILIPLFSIPSSRSWGIGEVGDLVPLARWLRSAGQQLLQLLPINELPPGETSPYSALSAMAIDPQFITLDAVEDFNEIGGEASLETRLQVQLEAIRLAATVQYSTVRRLKHEMLRRCFSHFHTREWESGTRRAAALRAFIDDQAWWLDEYSLFRALHARYDERPWLEWPNALRDRSPDALMAARHELHAEILFRQYVQWLASDQWGTARDETGDVQLFGDLPFMVSADSADVWTRQDQFQMDASVGVPPDAFSETGQDWGLPAYRWDVCAEREFEWLRDRARRNADLFDGYRVDHLVGFYRTYVRPHQGGEGAFTPADEADQLALGERILSVLQAPGAEIIAEDLGTVPDFVRESLARLGIPGYKVFRWEREWNEPGQPLKDPRDYPRCAVATSGTHDTDPMLVWWENAPQDERDAVLALPGLAERARNPDAPFEAILERLFESSADILILPVQDVFGWRDRINQPATVNDLNWTWRLPWRVDHLSGEPAAFAVATQLREWAEKSGRR